MTVSQPMIAVDSDDPDFARRHIGVTDDARQLMLDRLGFDDLEALMTAVVPAGVRSDALGGLPAAIDEPAVAAELRRLAAMNDPGEAMIGLGYHPTITPAVIRRNLLESPAWYTAYTPYQPEISQGRLEALLNFQTMIGDLTGLPVSNASLLDEGTAVAEAIAVMRRTVKAGSNRVVLDAECLPQTVAVVRTRCEAAGVHVVVADLSLGLPHEDFFGLVLQYPGASGVVRDYRELATEATSRGAMVTVAADLLSLTMLAPPGEWGADLVVGSAQRFGVPMGYGGPHAGFIAVRYGLERSLPGRLVGVSVDSSGNTAYRLALQTREQHIRRDKATSNICTAQVLLAVVAAMYAVYHGPDGLTKIAQRVHDRARSLATGLIDAGIDVVHAAFFDTVLVHVAGRADQIHADAAARGIWLRQIDADHLAVSCSEVTTEATVASVLAAFGAPPMQSASGSPSADRFRLPHDLLRTTAFLEHPVFHSYRSETAMLRYLRRLSDRDYALDRGMIPLGSCTMKLNATTEMEAIGLSGFADLHPFVPASAATGYHLLVTQLEGWLAEITGYAAVSVQPNAGSQGELAGLLAIRAYHRSKGDFSRDVCLIPASAHGTNAASAVMAGMRVVVVASRPDGTVDLEALEALCEEQVGRVAAAMVTYPSTHGVFEDGITELCRIVHDHGGQVYVDGANLNALIGLAPPGRFGGDVSHLNLHKTFCIPHGGGGPGVGPVAVAEHLAPFLPGHPMDPDDTRDIGIGPISAAPYGSAGILPISWAYIRLMGAQGLTEATKIAILAANYVAERLGAAFPVLYTGERGRVAHECILDLRDITATTGVTVDDVAKRLIDYGFHAPTMSFPVPGTLMIEPTESEDLAEIDRFCDAMIAIRGEIDQVAAGVWTAENSPLHHAPHTARALVGEWDRAYSRELAVFPAGISPDKYWPPVGRIDQSFGDRNLFCSCPPVEAYADQ